MEIFSLGMNDLAYKLRCHGYDAQETSWTLALHHAKCNDPRPLVIIGHSLGGRMCAWVSRKLMKCGERVPLIIIVDANLWQPIPPNVDKCLNLYVTNKIGIFHGSKVYPEFPGTPIVNWDVSQGQPPWYVGGVNHFDIDSTDWVHQIIIDEIDRAFASAARGPFTGGRQVISRSCCPSPCPLPEGVDTAEEVTFRSPHTVVRQDPCQQRSATAARTHRVSNVPAASSRQFGPVGASPGVAPPREPTPAATTKRAGEKVAWQPKRKPDFGENATPKRTADLSSKPSPGLRLRF